MRAIVQLPDLPDGFRAVALTSKTLVPFVGAGLSKLAGCPSWTEFADRTLKQFVTAGHVTHSWLDQMARQPPRTKLSIARLLQRQHGLKIDFKDVLYREGSVSDANVRGMRAYDALSKLGSVFVTTNYDEWLDSAISTPPKMGTTAPQSTPIFGQKRHVYHRVSDFTPDRLSIPNTVFHLHGAIESPDGMIMTTQDYITHYANDRRESENIVLTFLEELFTQKNILFVGYGLEELEILEYVIGKARLKGQTSERKLNHYILQGFFSHEAEVAASLEDYYAECGIELIPFSRDENDWAQLIEVLEHFSTLAPSGPPSVAQALRDMGDYLD